MTGFNTRLISYGPFTRHMGPRLFRIFIIMDTGHMHGHMHGNGVEQVTCMGPVFDAIERIRISSLVAK